MRLGHSIAFAVALPWLLFGCSSDYPPDAADAGSAPAASLAVAAAAGAAMAKPALTTSSDTATATPDPAAQPASPVDLATDESCRTLALRTIRQRDPKADRVFLDDSTPAGRYHREGNLISGAGGQYRTDAGWTPLVRFLCTVDDAGHAVSFTYEAGQPQTWAEMGNRH
jgi:hypothetical protein